MSEEATCGQGIAEQAALPSKLADLFAAIQQNLELHLTSLDPGDEVSKSEHAAYTRLVQQHRDVVTRLRSLAELMESYRDLPMANHDPGVLGSESIIEAFGSLVRREEELVDLLSGWTDRDRGLLDDFASQRPNAGSR